jgi:dephospho-CoA kinase
MARDKTTEAEVLKRMANQLPDEEKIKLSDFVIQ